jgi:hypothetical protein
MNVQEVATLIKQHDGISNAIEAKAIDPENLDDPILADKISDLWDLNNDIKEYIDNKIEDAKSYQCDDNSECN